MNDRDAYEKGRHGLGGYFIHSGIPSKNIDAYDWGVHEKYVHKKKEKKKKEANRFRAPQSDNDEDSDDDDDDFPEDDVDESDMDDDGPSVDEDVFENAVARVTDPHPRGHARVDRHRDEILKLKHYKDGEPERERINRRRDVEMDFTFKYRVLVIFCSIFLTYFIFRIIHALGFNITSLISILVSIASATITEIYMHHKKLSCDGKGHCMLFLKNFFECFIMISAVILLLHLL